MSCDFSQNSFDSILQKLSKSGQKWSTLYTDLISICDTSNTKEAIEHVLEQCSSFLKFNLISDEDEETFSSSDLNIVSNYINKISIEKSGNNHLDIMNKTETFKIVIPEYIYLNIRSKQSLSSDVNGKLSNNEIVEVFSTIVNEFYELTDGRGYFLSTAPNLTLIKQTSINQVDPSINQIEPSINPKLFTNMIKFINDNENDTTLGRAIQMLSFLKVSSKGYRKRSPKKKNIEEDNVHENDGKEDNNLFSLKENITTLLPSFLNYVSTDGNNLKSILVLLKLLLTTVEEVPEYRHIITLPMTLNSLNNLNNTKVLSKSDVSKILKGENEISRFKSFCCFPRILLIDGHPGKIRSLEVQGKTTGIIGGINAKINSGKKYFEVTLKGDNLFYQDIRVGWKKTDQSDKDYINKYKPGDDSNSWVFDGFTGCLYHDAISIISSKNIQVINDSILDNSELKEEKKEEIKKEEKIEDNFDLNEFCIYCPSGHQLQLSSRMIGWGCDARKESKGCKSHNKGLEIKNRFRCDRCDFDYCGSCVIEKILIQERAKIILNENKVKDKLNISELENPISDTITALSTPSLVVPNEENAIISTPDNNNIDVPPTLVCNDNEDNDNTIIPSIFQTPQSKSSVYSSSSPSLKTMPIEIFRKMLLKGLYANSVTTAMIEEGIPEDEIIDFLIAERKIDNFSGNLEKCIEKIYNQSIQIGINQGGLLLNTTSSTSKINMKNKWIAGTVISCLLDTDKSEMTFFVDGVKYTEIIMPNIQNALNQTGLCPVFSCSSGAGLEFNLGQTSFKFEPQSLKSTPSISKIWSSSISSYLTLPYNFDAKLKINSLAIGKDLIEPLFDEKIKSFLSICHFPSYLLNGITIEISCRIHFSDIIEQNHTFLSLVTCYIIDLENHKRFCQVSVLRNGSISFELEGCEKIISPNNIIKEGNWHHIAVTYSPNESNKNVVDEPYSCVISFLIDGKLEHFQNIDSSVNTLHSSQRSRIDEVNIGILLSSTKDENLKSIIDMESNSIDSIDICEVRIWCVACSASSILENLGRSKISGVENNLLTCLSFVEGSGSTIHNSVILNLKENDNKTYISNICCLPNWGVVEIPDSTTVFSMIETVEEKQRNTNILESLQNRITIIDNESFANIDLLISCINNNLHEGVEKNNEISMDKVNNSINSFRKFQLSFGNLKSISDPKYINFVLINSLLRQLIRMKISEKSNNNNINFNSNNDLENKIGLLDISITLLRVLAINFKDATHLGRLPASIGLQYSSESINICDNFVVKLLVTICSFVSISDSIFQEGSQELYNRYQLCQQISIDVIISGLDYFIPQSSDRLVLLECLLLKKYKSTHNTNCTDGKYSNSLAHEILNNFIPNLYLSDLSTPVEPIIALMSLSIEGEKCLLDRLCSHFSKLSNSSCLIPNELKPLSNSSSTGYVRDSDWIAVSGNKVVPLVGDLVKRGPDWCYNDQDGGKDSKGLITSITSWSDNSNYPNTCINVLWIESGFINSYRYGLVPFVGDVLTSFYDLEIYRSKEFQKSIENNEKVNEFVRRKLNYTPEEVTISLMEKIGGISKRTIFSYMKEIAPASWLESNNISKSVNTLQNSFSSDSVVKLYSVFYGLFSLPKAPPAKIISNSDNDISDHLKNVMSLLVDDVGHKFNVEAVTQIDSDNIISYESLNLLYALQGLVTGVIDSFNKNIFSSNKTPAKVVIGPVIASRIIKSPFMSSKSIQTVWNWEYCSWSKQTNKEVKVEIKDSIDFIFENNKSSIDDHILQGLTFDQNVSVELVISNSLRKVTQTAKNKWSTVIGSFAMHPNTGVYRWYTKIDCLGRRGHCMFGIASGEFSYDKFLGQDEESIGFTTIKDFFQNGRKIKTDYKGKLTVGGIVECIFDTDTGTLSFSDPMLKDSFPLVVCTDLEEITYYPAWSLFTKDDSLSILKHSNVLHSDSGIENSRNLAMKGVPSSLVIHHCINLILSATSMLKESHLAILNPLISTCLAQILSTISRYQRISTYQDKILNSSLNTLLQVLWDAFRIARDSFHWSSTDSYDEGEKNIEKIKKIKENHKLAMELIIQLSCISCFYLGLLSSSWINGMQFNQINNQTIACEIMNEFQFQGPSLTSSVASQQFKDSINQPKEEMVKKDWLKSNLFAFGIKNSKEEHPKLIKDFLNFSPTGPASCLLKWILRHDRTHPNLQKVGGEYLNQAVQLLFAANIYHSGFLRLTTTLAFTLYEYSISSVSGSLDALEKIMSMKPPTIILLAWELAMELRVRSKKEVQNDEISFEMISRRCITRALFLFDIEQSRPEQIISNLGVNDVVQYIVSFTNEFAHQQIIIQVSKDISLFSTIENPSFFRLKVQLKTVEKRAILREEGLKATRNNLGQVPDDCGCGAKCIILYHLPSALTSQVCSIPQFYNQNLSATDIRHYHYGLEGSSISKKIEIKGSFESLFSHLTDELTRSITIGDISLQLSILACLGVRILEDDHDMLSRVSIFHVLQDLLDNVNDPSVFESCDETLTSSGFEIPVPQEGFGFQPQAIGFTVESTREFKSSKTLENPNKSPFQNVTQAAMKVFILLALQVANSVDRESVMSINFVRARSGPATLSSAVFDILFERISSIMTGMIDSLQVEYKIEADNDSKGCKVVSTEIPEDSYVVLNEASMLLLCIVKDSYCKKLLNTSRWIQLLLDMSLLCPLECQQRCLLILTDLFAVVNIKELEKVGPDMISHLSWYFRLFEKEDKSSSIQEVIVKIMSSMCSKSLVINEVELIVHKQGSSKETFDYSLNSIPISSDVISLIRSLLNLSDWSQIVEDVLLAPLETALIIESPVTLDISTMRAVIATLSIFGGHCDFHYPQGAAIICDLVSGRDSELGVITSISDDNVEFLTVKSNLEKKTNNSEISNTDQNLDVSIISIDRLKPINRFPCQYLKISERIINILLNIVFHITLSTDSITNTSLGFNTVNQDNNNLEEKIEKELIEEKSDDKEIDQIEFKIDNSSTYEILRLTSLRCLTSLSVHSSSADIIQKLILDSNNHRLNYEFLVKLLEKSVKDSDSCSLSDINIFDDYLTLALLQRRRILLNKIVEEVKIKKSDDTKNNVNSDTNLIRKDASIFQNKEIIPKVEISPLIDIDAVNMASNENLFEHSSNSIFKELQDLQEDEDEGDEDEGFVHGMENAHDIMGERDNSLIEMLNNMGFPKKYCEIALQMCGGDFDEALHYLLANGENLEQIFQSNKNNNILIHSNNIQQEQSNISEIIEEKSQDNFGSFLHSPTETIVESNFVRNPFALENDSHSDNSISLDNPKKFYFHNIGSKFLPIYTLPNSASDRLGSINPGEDILAFGEATESHNGKRWLKIRIEDYIDEFDVSNEDVYAWIPRYLGNNEVVRQGTSQNIPSILENMSPDSISIKATYKIIGVNGCIVRKGVETTSNEVMILKPEDLVSAVEECFNSNGKLRLRITNPVNGWISKLIGLVVKVSDDKIDFKVDTENLNISQIKLSELEMLEQVDDDMEQYGGSDLYRKEDRLFGSLQGLQYQRCRDKSKSNNLYNLRSRIMGSGTRSLAKKELGGKSLLSIDTIIESKLKNVIILYCRKSMLSILYRNECPDLQKFNQLAIGDSFVPILLYNVIMNSKNVSTIEKSHSAYNNNNFPTLFTKFLSLCSFRGDPYSIVGIEYISMDEISFLTVNVGSLTTDIILRPMIIKLVKKILIPTNEEATILKFELFQQEFRKLLLSEVTKNIRHACQSKFSEQSWTDCKYDEDSDEESKNRGNIHFSLWISRILISTDIYDLILSVFNVWCLALRAASLSLKQIAVTILSEVLDLLKNKIILSSQKSINKSYNSELIDLLYQCKLLIPGDRLYMMSCKRLWYEMEDNPAYSRFLQAVIHLLSEMEEVERIFPISSMQKSISSRSLQLVENSSIKDELSVTESIRSVIRFDTGRSHVQLSPQKDLQGSWTVEFYLCLDEQNNMIIKPEEKNSETKPEVPVEIPKVLCTNNHQLSKGVNFYAGLSSSYSCDICRKSYKDSEERWCCHICKYDACLECVPHVDTYNNKNHSSLTPLYLLSSPGGFIKVRSGGRLFNQNMANKSSDEICKNEINDPAQETDFVCERAFCLSFGQNSGSEHIFDSIIPSGKWVHIALAYNHSQSGNMTLYIDGDMKDRISAKFHLPIATIGNSRLNGSSFTGDFAEMRVWSSARTSLEIKRDMQTNVNGAKGLVSHLQCKEGYGLRTFDSAGLLNNCKLSGCSWANVAGPVTKITNIPYFILSESSEEQEGLFGEDIGSSAGVVEMTGTLTREAIPGQGDSTSNSEVVCLCYRIKNGTEKIDEPNNQILEGYIDWCERGVRSQMTGCLTKDGIVTLDISKDSTVLGAPESMEWLQGLSFQGILSNGKIKGSLSYSTNVSCPSPLREGECRLDLFQIPVGVTVKNDFNFSFPSKTVLTVDEGKEEGQYFITVEVNQMSGKRKTLNKVSPIVISNEIPYGIRPNEGSIWVQWLVNACPSGSICIGISTFNAMKDNDSCVFANPDAWCCTASGSASVGVDLSEIEQIEVGDILGVHLNTNSGELYIYRNEVCLHYFSEVNLHPSMLGVDIPLSQVGVRPFACLSSAGDSISFLGVKKGDVKIKYLEEDVLNRDTFIGSVNYGNFNGHCQISYQGDSGHWYGEYIDGKRYSLHLRFENTGNDEVLGSIHTVFDNDVEIQKFEMDEKTYESLSIEEGKQEVKQEEEKKNNSKSENNNNEDLFLLFKEIYDLYKISKKATVTKNESALKSVFPFPFGGDRGSGAENDGELKRFISGDFDSSRGSSPRNNEYFRNVTFKLRDQSGGPEMHFKVSVNVRLQKVIDVYASKRGVPIKSFWFQYNGVKIGGDATPEILKLRDDDIIDVVLAPSSPKSSKEDLEKLLLESTAPYILQIIYANGATVRSGIEIDESSSVRILQCGEYFEAFQKIKNKEGIIRYRIVDGWISGRLRAVTEDLVVKVMRYLPTKPIEYIVVKKDGAKLRSEVSRDSTDLGFVPQDTIISVVEKRLDVINGEEVTRLRIESPSQWQGWISDKPQICKLTDSANTDEDMADHEILSEISRRISVRQRRANLNNDLNSSNESSKEPRRLISINGSLEVSSDTLFLINGSQKKSGVTVSPDFCTVSCGIHGGRSMAFGSRGFTRGLHYWEVQVNAANWGGVFIGVSPIESSSWSGYGLLNYRATQAFGCETLYGSYFNPGDKIGVLLDMDHGTISFIKDGEDFNAGKHVVINMGVAYHNLRRSNRSSNSVLYPCFGVKGSGDELSIRKCKWVSRKGLGSSSLLNHILKSKGIMSQWRRTYLSSLQFSKSLLQELYQSYIRWRAHDKRMVPSRAGIEVAIDTTIDSMKKVTGSLVENHKIHAGLRFRCSQYGEGIIIGTRSETQIWYIYDEIFNGAWYWTQGELAELLDSGIVCLLTDTIDNNSITSVATTTDAIISTTDINVNILERSSSFNVPSENNVISTNIFNSIKHSPRAILSYTQFEHSLTDESWNVDDDEQIVALINQISNKLDIDPLRISSTILEEFRSNSSILSTKSSVDIEARYAALCVLNKASSIALAFVDFGNGDSRCPLVRASINSNLNIDMSDGLSQSGHVVKDIKKVLFTRTKLGLWNLSLKETTTTTGAPPDEYERPDDLKEININRVECRNTEKNKKISLTERFRLSVFGQLMEGMRNWDDRSLRRGFIHMQDEGQPRSFFVKFTGEGVDDHGGPYRAVFQTAIAEEATGPLCLLVKSPNCESDTGSNKEKLILNPELIASPERLNLYTFLGKLIGMACRHSILVPLNLPTLIWKPLSGEILEISDLQAVDSSLLKSLNDIAECTMSLEDIADNLEQALIPRSGKEEGGSFIDSFAASMSAILSSYNNSEINDTNFQISLSNTVNRLCSLIQLLRITSHSQGLSHLYKGLSAVLPTELFPLFTSHELEELFCGQCEIDLEVLKKATVYDGVLPTDVHIIMFWDVLESLDQVERAQLINFCSGRSRLPLAAEDFPMKFKLTMPPIRSKDKPDDYLPIAQTCFFSLSLPKYTSFEICKQKIKYAINNTELMDADFVMRNANGWENVK